MKGGFSRNFICEPLTKIYHANITKELIEFEYSVNFEVLKFCKIFVIIIKVL